MGSDCDRGGAMGTTCARHFFTRFSIGRVWQCCLAVNFSNRGNYESGQLIVLGVDTGCVRPN